MAASSGHVRKRQFQPSIDSFFNRDGISSSTPRSRTEDALAPTLPEETQASLLSVGMRVRKSVPEGYKTHKTIGVYISPIASSAPAPVRAAKTKQRYTHTSQRELVPMCGLHKTGGFASQLVTSSAPAAMYSEEDGSDSDWDENEDDLPGLSHSQSTLQSTFDTSKSGPSISNKKRGYEEEMEENLDVYFNDDTAMDSPGPDAFPRTRPLAKMKLPYRGETRGRGAAGGGNDFDEASFLAPDGMDVDDF